jgi:two-component system chemotaxis response regulator CheB
VTRHQAAPKIAPSSKRKSKLDGGGTGSHSSPKNGEKNRNGAARSRAKAPVIRASRQGLSGRLRAERAVLIASVTAGGLCDARPRSIAARVHAEAGQFLDLLAAVIDKKPKDALAKRVCAEVRSGSFAAASLGDVEAIFKVWKRTLQAFAASQGRSLSEATLLRAVARLETMVLKEARGWVDERIDVIVIGSSAGGIFALQETLSALSEDLPATILIVQHVSSKAPSLLPLVIGRNCELNVVHAVEGARLFLGHVYIAPPGRHLVVSEHRIHLSDAPPVRYSKLAADLLFQSAATLYGKHVASVVLSGADGDGANGSRAVRDAGGMVIAQHPGSAQFPSMPESAIATGTVELVVNLPLLGKVIERVVREGRSAVRERV